MDIRRLAIIVQQECSEELAAVIKEEMISIIKQAARRALIEERYDDSTALSTVLALIPKETEPKPVPLPEPPPPEPRKVPELTIPAPPPLPPPPAVQPGVSVIAAAEEIKGAQNGVTAPVLTPKPEEFTAYEVPKNGKVRKTRRPPIDYASFPRTVAMYYVLIATQLDLDMTPHGTSLTKHRMHTHARTQGPKHGAFKGWPNAEESQDVGGKEAWMMPFDEAVEQHVTDGHLIKEKTGGSTYIRTDRVINPDLSQLEDLTQAPLSLDETENSQT